MFKPLHIPRDLQRNLPFKEKPKVAKKMVDPVESGRVAVIRDAKEKKVSTTVFSRQTALLVVSPWRQLDNIFLYTRHACIAK